MKKINFNRQKVLYIAGIIIFLVTIILAIIPVANLYIRAGIVFGAICIWALILILFWKKIYLRVILFSLLLIPVLILVLPGSDADPETLRTEYANSLVKYEGTTYVWGGENALGIDCSGLVRQGLINADLKMGISEFNPRLIREGLSLWWYDSSAKALGEEYRGKTRFMFEAASINKLDHSKIKKGDFAVTSDGRHTLVYIGDKVWIEADPDYRKVIKVNVPDVSVPDNRWFNRPVKIIRWKQMENN